jgi:hypothetical protein
MQRCHPGWRHLVGGKGTCYDLRLNDSTQFPGRGQNRLCERPRRRRFDHFEAGARPRIRRTRCRGRAGGVPHHHLAIPPFAASMPGKGSTSSRVLRLPADRGLPPPGGTEYASIVVARLPRYATPRGTGKANVPKTVVLGTPRMPARASCPSCSMKLANRFSVHLGGASSKALACTARARSGQKS